MKAIARHLRITPRKLNLIAGLVRGKDANEAMSILRFTPKKGAKLLFKAVKSAVSNAENNFKQERDSLYVKEIVVNKGITLKRNVPISRGRVHPILKRSAHLYVTVGVKENAAESVKKEAKEKEAPTSKPPRQKKPSKSQKSAKPTINN
jgi:large subunit ribosomal protein L22